MSVPFVTVHIDYSDGNFSMHKVEAGAEYLPAHGHTRIPEPLYDAWVRYCEGAHAWHRILGNIDGDRYAEMNEPHKYDARTTWDKAREYCGVCGGNPQDTPHVQGGTDEQPKA